MANVLSKEKRAQIIACLVEGNSLRSTARLTGTAFNTVLKFVPWIGKACADYQDQVLRGLKCQRIEADEIWAFIGCKEANVKKNAKGKGRGDCYTWTALDPDTKLIVCWHVGLREAADGILFMERLAERLSGRVQLSTDGHPGYLSAVENAFGVDVDYGRVVKIFGMPSDLGRTEVRYSPSKCKEIKYISEQGNPALEHICTSHNERQNLSMRMGIRRFTRLTNAFSKKQENHGHAVALYFMYYNFCRIHQSLRVTPAMAAGLTSKVWELADLVDLIDQNQEKAA